MFDKPRPQHEWLHQLIGNWKFSHECVMGPDQPPTTTVGTVDATSMGGFWVILNCSGQSDPTQPWTSQFHLGFDPAKERFVGGFIASMMPQLWIYDGELNSEKTALTLNAEGPSFRGDGTAKYQDIIEIVDSDSWTLRSQILTPEGNWVQFMLGRHERVKE